MTNPEMIIFDYGDTLLCERDWNSARGNAELMKYIVENPNNCTLEDISSEVQKVFGEKFCVTSISHQKVPFKDIT